MKDRHIFLIAAMLVFVMAFFFLKGKKRHRVVEDTEVEEIQDTRTAAPKINLPNPAATATEVSQMPTAIKPIAQTQNNLVSEAVMKNFVSHMREVEKCLKLRTLNMGVAVDPTPDNLIGLLRPSLGEQIVQIDDWTQFDITDKSGVKKRIRVDYDYPDGVTPNRRLSSYTVNSYGSLEIDNLTADQTDNPNEAYVESLKEGAQLHVQESASRMYFAQGEEVAYTIKNGRIDTINISRGENAVNCSGLGEEGTSKCSCP